MTNKTKGGSSRVENTRSQKSPHCHMITQDRPEQGSASSLAHALPAAAGLGRLSGTSIRVLAMMVGDLLQFCSSRLLCCLSHTKALSDSHFTGLGATVPGPSPVLKGFGARQLQCHYCSGFAMGASHSFPAVEQRVKQVSSSKRQQVSSSKRQRLSERVQSCPPKQETVSISPTVKAKLVLGPLSSRSGTSAFLHLLERKLMLARLSSWLKNCPGCQ